MAEDDLVAGHEREGGRISRLGAPMVEVCHTLWYRDDACFAVPRRGKAEIEVAAPPWATASISSTSPSLLRLGNKIGSPPTQNVGVPAPSSTRAAADRKVLGPEFEGDP
ncbi:hypothetical protein [Streptomyces sp. YU58]|uniref:hypothetical protein n=1 Tax=Streptomyces sp. SX92 TaxID=3158972 RepID=UPI0027B91818|nr:hypothetical protein [Streptomyces coralus]